MPCSVRYYSVIGFLLTPFIISSFHKHLTRTIFIKNQIMQLAIMSTPNYVSTAQTIHDGHSLPDFSQLKFLNFH